MPNRFLKESICTSVTLDNLSAEEERFFYRLIVQCDDFGRFYAHPGIVRGHCFPRKTDITLEQMTAWLDALDRARLIERYESEGEMYLQVVTWQKHQQTRAKASKFPAPDSEGSQPIAPAFGSQASDDTREHLIASDSNGSQMSPYSYSYPDTYSAPISRSAEPPSEPNEETEKPKPKRSKPPHTPITPEDIEDLVEKYRERYGDGQTVRAEIEAALNNQARLKNFNERLYVDGWLRRQLDFRTARAPNGRASNGRPEPLINRQDRTFEDNV